MKCPICNECNLDDVDNVFVCAYCGSTFYLEYLGYTEEGASDTIEDYGSFPAEYTRKWSKEISKFKYGK